MKSIEHLWTAFRKSLSIFRIYRLDLYIRRTGNAELIASQSSSAPFLARIPIPDGELPLCVRHLQPLGVDYGYLHTHPELEICYFPSDVGTFMIEDREFLIEPGDMFIVNAGDVHQPVLDRKQNDGAVVLYFRPALLLGWEDEWDLLMPFVLASRFGFNKLPADERPRSVFKELHAAQSSVPDSRWPTVCRGMIHHLLAIIAYCFAERCEAEGVEVQVASAHRFAPVLTHIDRNLHRRILARDIYSLAMLSHSQFSSMFRITFGVSLFEYIRQQRIRRARRLLLSTRMSITEIAYSVGFSSSSFFSTAFNDYERMSPRAFRSSRLKRVE